MKALTQFYNTSLMHHALKINVHVHNADLLIL